MALDSMDAIDGSDGLVPLPTDWRLETRQLVKGSRIEATKCSNRTCWPVTAVARDARVRLLALMVSCERDGIIDQLIQFGPR